MASHTKAPYLSVVVTSRNDNHGGDLNRRRKAGVDVDQFDLVDLGTREFHRPLPGEVADPGEGDGDGHPGVIDAQVPRLLHDDEPAPAHQEAASQEAGKQG